MGQTTISPNAGRARSRPKQSLAWNDSASGWQPADKERTTAWKFVGFFAAGLIFFSIFSCATLKQSLLPEESKRHLLDGQKLLAQKDYDGALSEFQKVLSVHPSRPLEEEALFNMGLVYAHFGNPKRDYAKSLNLFLRILNDYPESRLAEQAKVWVGVLQANLATTKNFEKLKKSMKDRRERTEGLSDEGGQRLARSQKLLAQGNYEGAAGEGQRVLASTDLKSSKDEALFNLGLIYAHSGNPQRDIQKSLEYFRKLIKNYPKSPFVEQAKIWVGILEENEELNYVIQKLKQVDIDIEEMKRNRPP
jgi:outer membrane protein assembly factor BamD (BamD/ComL family)